MSGRDDDMHLSPEPEASTSMKESMDREPTSASRRNVARLAPLLPIERQYPPPFLGFIPTPHSDVLSVDGLETVRLCTCAL